MAALRQRRDLRLTARRLLAGALLLLLAVLPAGEAWAQPAITVTPGRYGDYYHLRLSLGAGDIDFAASSSEASAGGQFDIRLRPAALPVPAPNCAGNLILRMPWSNPRDEGAAERIAAKRRLLTRLLALRDAPRARVAVVVELNPYVEVVGRDPLRLRLSGCNLFFRHGRGAYIPHLDPLPPR